jgi:hypothetical protein
MWYTNFVGASVDSVPKRSENVVFRKVAGEYILIPLVASAADVESIFNLNETGAAVWDKVDGAKSIKDIVAELRAEYEAKGDQLEKDIIALIDEMTEAKLILVL